MVVKRMVSTKLATPYQLQQCPSSSTSILRILRTDIRLKDEHVVPSNKGPGHVTPVIFRNTRFQLSGLAKVQTSGFAGLSTTHRFPSSADPVSSLSSSVACAQMD